MDILATVGALFSGERVSHADTFILAGVVLLAVFIVSKIRWRLKKQKVNATEQFFLLLKIGFQYEKLSNSQPLYASLVSNLYNDGARCCKLIHLFTILSSFLSAACFKSCLQPHI